MVSAIEQVQSLDYYELIKNSAARFAIGNLFFGYNNFISDYDSDDAREYYNFIHEYFNSEQFAFVTYDSIKHDVLWRFFLMIRYNEYEKLRENQKKKLLVYTARIDLTMPLGSEKAFDVLDISDYHAFCKSQQWLKKRGKMVL